MRAAGRPSSSPPSRSSSWDRNFPPMGSGRPPPPTLGFGSSRRRSARPARRKRRRCATSPRSGPGGPTSTPPSPRTTRRSARSRPASAPCRPRSIGSPLARSSSKVRPHKRACNSTRPSRRLPTQLRAVPRRERGADVRRGPRSRQRAGRVRGDEVPHAHVEPAPGRGRITGRAEATDRVPATGSERAARAVRGRAGTGARRTRPDRNAARRAAEATGRGGAGRGPGTRARGVDPIAEGQVQLAAHLAPSAVESRERHAHDSTGKATAGDVVQRVATGPRPRHRLVRTACAPDPRNRASALRRRHAGRRRATDQGRGRGHGCLRRVQGRLRQHGDHRPRQPVRDVVRARVRDQGVDRSEGLGRPGRRPRRVDGHVDRPAPALRGPHPRRSR